MSYAYATSNYERSEKTRQELYIEQKENANAVMKNSNTSSLKSNIITKPIK